MTTTILDLCLKNFGPYRDEHKLDLSVTPNAPVVLIFGENTLGKSQLFSALRWCLYGTFAAHQSEEAARMELPFRLNRPARDAGDNELEVKATVLVDGTTYDIRRHSRFFANATRPDIRASLRIGATVVPEASIETQIGRSFTHKSPSSFFLMLSYLKPSMSDCRRSGNVR